MHKPIATALLLTTALWLAGCRTLPPAVVSCPDPTPIPEALATRPAPQSMQEELRALLESLLPDAPGSGTD